MPPPAKRQKRNVVYSSPTDFSETERGDPAVPSQAQSDSISSPVSTNNGTPPAARKYPFGAPTTPTKPRPKALTANHPHNAAPIYLPNRGLSRTGGRSTSSSPEKTRTKAETPEKGKSGDLLKLFSSQRQRQSQQASSASQAFESRRDLSALPIEEDNIDPIVSDDDDVGDDRAQKASFIGAAARKRAHHTTGTVTDIITSSQKFARKQSSVVKPQSEEDLRPWADRFPPMTLDELVVHKKKVTDVRSWLEAVFAGRIRQRVLILKGAAGTGKTSTVRLLARDMDCNILEWHNPDGSINSVDGFVSIAAQFEEFMGRGGKFGQLDIFSEPSAAPAKPSTAPLDRRKNIMLVEEFPNTFTRSSTALQSFRSCILQYLASSTPSLSSMYNRPTEQATITPLILIVSETLLTTSTASADSFTAHRLLGPEILHHPGVTVVEFNAIAPTLLAKALELVVMKESRKSGRRKTPGPLVLKKLGEIGDVRSAIGSLEFLCVRGDENGDWGARVAFTKGKRPGASQVPLTKMEQESLELVTRREASLGIFHAVGKVVYNKREDATSDYGNEDNPENLPYYLSDMARPKKSLVFVDELIDETGTDTETFVAALHENYILSCDAPENSFEFSDLDHVNGCIDALSDCDLVCPAWDSSSNFRSGSSGDIFRQDELCFQIAVRGILFSLPNPVKRKAPAAGGLRQGRGGDAFKMFYPTSLKLWRMKEEIDSTVDLWTTRMIKGEHQADNNITSGASMFARAVPGSVETWKSSRAMDISSKGKAAGGENDGPTLISMVASAKRELLLERFPYMTLLAQARKIKSLPIALKEMEKVTIFTGIGGPLEDVADEGDEGAAVTEEWATDKPVDESPRKKRTTGGRWERKSAGNTGLEARFAEQKLVLSDDDIEDD